MTVAWLEVIVAVVGMILFLAGDYLTRHNVKF